MESILQRSALAAKTTSKAKTRVRALLGARRNVVWIVTALFCLQMSFTA
jgi:hypothetical protein